MKYEHDLAVIGLGPAGMAVSIMGAEMGLSVCAIEANKIGGECMNVGCIPSKALLRMGKMRAGFDKLEDYGLAPTPRPEVRSIFPRIQEHLKYINEAKTRRMFANVNLVLGEGKASFVDRHTLAVREKRITARRIFICAGTRPALPPIEGLDQVPLLTNENLFNLPSVPESMIVIGSGAIASEMAQGFARLGARVTMVMRGKGLMWRTDGDARALIEDAFERDGITLKTNRTMKRVEATGSGVRLLTEEDGAIEATHILVATGRRMDFASMKLDNAGVAHSERGIEVNPYLRTTARNIYAPGDCNGYAQFSHAAMHQGMLALINSMMPWPMKRRFKRYLVPWTVFTEPQYSWVGPSEEELNKRKVRYETVVTRHEDYGAAIAENLGKGFVKVLVSPAGRIHAAGVVGEGSGEMINEWALAIQNRIRMHKIMLLQHSFPTMAFLNKRVSEEWAMNRMKSSLIKKMCRFMFRLG
ncbi:MAG: NAD(P)/FAD-dependent oxidoreductase [Phycisphaeraceae bacterium]|nr:NAD(P)/FAD-dependent oxidoreductase [Phycisphaeraceae bacterium]